MFINKWKPEVRSMMNCQVMRRLAAVGLLLMSTAALCQEYEKIDEIVAIVDEGVILRSELEEAMRAIEAQFQARGERLPPQPVLQEQVLERLISQQVQLQRAEATGVRVSDQQVDRSLDDVARQNNLSLSQLRQALESEGGDFNEFREDVREQLIISMLHQRIVESMEEATETEIDLLLESDGFGGDEYNLSQIAFRLPPNPSPEQMREVQQRVEQAQKALAEGMDFAAAAVNFSDSPDALDGGQVGWRNLNMMPRELADSIGGLQSGQVAPPVLVGSSVLMVRVNERRPRGEIIVGELQARHILIQPSELVSPERARQLAEELHVRLEAGEEFEALAREYSDDPRSANLGGLLDWFPEGAYGEVVQQVCDSLEPGQTSQPFQTNQGWHILRLEGQRKADRTVEALRAEAHNLLMEQRADQEIEDMLRRFRDEAFVEKLL